MSIGNIKDYTPNFKFIIPSFDIATWHDYIEENFRNIDALFYNLFGINNYNGTWKKITSYTAGQVLFVGEDKDLEGNDTDYAGRLVKVLVDHTTDNSDYFNIYYNLHPEYYELFADASTAQQYAQIAQNNANITTNLRQETEGLYFITNEVRNETQLLRNQTLLFRNNAEDFSTNAETSANNAQVSATNAQDYLNLTQETYYNAVNEVNSVKSEAIIQIDQNADQKIAEFDNLAIQNTQTATNLLNQTQIAAQNAQNYANEAWGKISNVGDIFYSLRLDDELNGAVVCNGNYYELEDFTGTHSIKNLLEQNKLPYVSLEEYENTLNTYGSVRCFGYDVGGTQFRVPTLDDVYIKTGIANLPNEFNVESLPNITGNIIGLLNHSSFQGSGALSSALYSGSKESSYYGSASNYTAQIQKTSFDASRSSSTYKTGAKVNPDNVRYRAFVQLANAATENAIISATSAISRLADASYKSLAETYSGQKIFEQSLIQQMPFAYTEAPSNTRYFGYVLIDKNGETWGSFEGIKYSSGTNCVQMTVKGNSGNIRRFYIQENVNGAVTYNYGQTAGSQWIKIPKGANSAVLICWGNIGVANAASSKIVSFPTAYSEAPKVALTSSGGSTQVYQNVVNNITSTNFKMICTGEAASQGFHWIAVGNAAL